MQHPGSCLCGSIRYRFSHGEYPVAKYHRSMCRRASAVCSLDDPESFVPRAAHPTAGA